MRSIAFAIAVGMVAAPAAAEPVRLTNAQMDGITAGLEPFTISVIVAGAALAYGLYEFSEWAKNTEQRIPEVQKAIEEGRYEDYAKGVQEIAAEGVRAGGGVPNVVKPSFLDVFVDLIKTPPKPSPASYTTGSVATTSPDSCARSSGCYPARPSATPSSNLSSGPRYSIIEIRDY